MQQLAISTNGFQRMTKCVSEVQYGSLAGQLAFVCGDHLSLELATAGDNFCQCFMIAVVELLDSRLEEFKKICIQNHTILDHFCQPGMILAARQLVGENPSATRGEIRSALASNLCRCTGNVKILDAVELACAREHEAGA